MAKITDNPKEAAFHNVWAGMKRRCNNPNTNNFCRYGALGIKVSKRWELYKNFKEDMYDSYLSVVDGKWSICLDRIDNSLGYSKDNCRWATYRENNNNRSNSRIIEYNGKSMTMREWAEHLGLKRSTLAQRIYSYGWSLDKALRGGTSE